MVNGTFGGAGATWTPGDTITAAAGTTGQTFNITGNGPVGNINVTNLAGNTVSGVATVNVNANTVLGALNAELVTGDFTDTGPMKAWTGLTALNVNSGSSIIGGTDTLTALVTTAVLVNDTAVAVAAGQAMTVNGSLTTTINETNIGANAGAILVNGGAGTTTVTVKQTELAPGGDAFVKITDAGFATKAAGTITSITLDGLSHGVTHTFTSPGAGLAITGTILNTISDNALANLTINNSDTGGAALSIIDNLTPATATTLNLNLSHDGVGATGFATTAASALTLVDTNNEISTIHLVLGGQNSYVNLVDNGLVTLDTPTAGTGALVASATGNLGAPTAAGSTITDHVDAAVNFNFSGLNGPNNIDVDRVSGVATDVYTLGNFGTNADGANQFTTAQHLVIENTNANNRDTINFGSGAYDIADAAHNAIAVHAYVNTAPNGAGIIAGFSPVTGGAPWAEITGATASVVPGSGDTLQFANGIQFTQNIAAATVAAGIATAVATVANTASVFTVAGNTYVFDHAGTSQVSVSPTDALVEFVGITFTGNTVLGPNGTGIVHFL